MELKNVTKRFGRKDVLNSINVHIDKGIYGLLGANGAGKSTLMKIMIGELQPTKGAVIYTHHGNRWEFYRSLGYLPQTFNAPKEMTTREYLMYISRYKGMSNDLAKKKVKALTLDLNLEGYIDKKIGTWSGGTLQRVGIAQAFINNPKFVILDEPSSGLDISERRNLKNFISKEASESSVLISTHIISDVEYILDWLLVMKAGEILEQIKYQDAIKKLDGRVWNICLENRSLELFKQKLKALGGVVTNINIDNPKKNFIRYVCIESIYQDADSKEPELNDYYLWMTEGWLYE